jgi:hypothetical protein
LKAAERAAAQRRHAVQRAMRVVTAAVADDDTSAYLGTGLLYSLRSLATTSADAALRAQARALGRHAFRRWEQAAWQGVDAGSADWLGEAVRGYGAGLGLGLRRPAVVGWLRGALQPLGARELIGFDVRSGPPAAGRPGAFRTWCVGLTAAWCGEVCGAPLGARYGEVLAWLPAMRGYEHAFTRQRRDFHDVAYAVTHVVYTLNGYGRCRLDPAWLPHEHLFLRAALPEAIAIDDVDLAAELVDTLRAFGAGDDDALVRRGYDHLMQSQAADGTWGRWDGEHFYAGFHATWAAIDGLREYRWGGPQLMFPALLPMLQRWVSVR